MGWNAEIILLIWYSLEDLASIIVLILVLYRKYGNYTSLYEKIIQNLCLSDLGLEICFLLSNIINFYENNQIKLQNVILRDLFYNFFIVLSLLWTVIISYSVHQSLTNPNFQIEEKYNFLVMISIVTSILISLIGLYFQIAYFLSQSISDVKILDYSEMFFLVISILTLIFFYVVSLYHLRKVGFDLQYFYKQLLLYPCILMICWLPILICEILVFNNIIIEGSKVSFYVYVISESMLQIIGLFDALAYGWRDQTKNQTISYGYEVPLLKNSTNFGINFEMSM